MIPGESEKHFQAEVIRVCRALRRRVYFTQRSIGSPSGWPDLVIVGGRKMLIRELKTNTGVLTPTQQETHALLQACDSFDVAVWRPRDWPQIMEELRA